MAYGAISQNGTQRVAAAPRKRRLVALAAGALALAVLGVATVRPGGVGRAVGSFAETAPGAGLASASQDGSSTSGEAEKEADCGLKDLAYFTMIGDGEATFERAGVQGAFTFYNFSIGASNLAPVVAVRVEDGDRDMRGSVARNHAASTPRLLQRASAGREEKRREPPMLPRLQLGSIRPCEEKRR